MSDRTRFEARWLTEAYEEGETTATAVQVVARMAVQLRAWLYGIVRWELAGLRRVAVARKGVVRFLTQAHYRSGSPGLECLMSTGGVTGSGEDVHSAGTRGG